MPLSRCQRDINRRLLRHLVNLGDYLLDRKTVSSISIIALVTVLFIATLPPSQSAQFFLASWEFPDEHGQGILGIWIYENSTGSWVSVEFYSYDRTDTALWEWNSSVAIKLEAFTYVNKTFLGWADGDEGKLYQRHNVTVTNSTDDIIFSQNNFTFYSYDYNSPADPNIWTYRYTCILNFLPVFGGVYTAVVTYEIWW